MSMVSVKKIILDLMHEYDLNQKELGKKLGISEYAISRYLSGKSNPTMKDYKKLYDEWEKYQPIQPMFPNF